MLEDFQKYSKVGLKRKKKVEFLIIFKTTILIFWYKLQVLYENVILVHRVRFYKVCFKFPQRILVTRGAKVPATFHD